MRGHKIRERHSLADKTVRLKLKGGYPESHAGVHIHTGDLFTIEDWWINVSGVSWMYSNGNLACMGFAVRSALANLPTDDEVVYGKVGPFGHLVHVSELGEVMEQLNAMR